MLGEQAIARTVDAFVRFTHDVNYAQARYEASGHYENKSYEECRRCVYDALKKAAAQEPKARADGKISDANTMPFIVDCVRAYATVGEICDALRDVYGTYEEVSIT